MQLRLDGLDQSRDHEAVCDVKGVDRCQQEEDEPALGLGLDVHPLPARPPHSMAENLPGGVAHILQNHSLRLAHTSKHRKIGCYRCECINAEYAAQPHTG